MVWGVKKCHTYLYGREFDLVTDHQPLVSIFHPEKGIPATTTAKLQRYALYLLGLKYTIGFKGTKLHGNADGLSRLHLPEEDTDELDSTHLYMLSQFDSLPVTPRDIRQATAKDPVLARVYDATMSGWGGQGHKYLAPFYSRRTELSVHQGCITWGVRVVIPQKLRPKVINQLHEGHLGIVKVKSLARSFVW